MLVEEKSGDVEINKNKQEDNKNTKIEEEICKKETSIEENSSEENEMKDKEDEMKKGLMNLDGTDNNNSNQNEEGICKLDTLDTSEELMVDLFYFER